MDEFATFFTEYQDYLAPRLDGYEQAVYLYVSRYTIAVGKRETAIGFGSARKKMAFGVGKAGTAPSAGVIYEKLKSLESKGCIKVLSSERLGTRLTIITPREIPGLIQETCPQEPISLDEVDFFDVLDNRALILEREGNRCFYCLVKLDKNNYVIEHVISRPIGNNSYKNVVAACRQCNNRKNSMLAEDYLRMIYREGLLNANEFKGRQAHLERLSAGELKPKLGTDS